MSVDYNEQNQRAGKGGGRSRSFSDFSGVRNPESRRNNNKETGYVHRKSGKGGASQERASGTDNMHINRVCRPVDTAHNKNKQVWNNGGQPSRKVVRGRVQGVKVQPE